MAIPKLALIPSGVKAGKLYSVLPTNGDGDFTTTRNTVATRVNENGLIEEVASNVPRLDYSDGGCPSLLLENSSTNLITYSEAFDNAYWTKNGSSVTSGFVSPKGDLSAFKLVEDTSTGSHSLSASALVGVSDLATSIYVKYAGSEYIVIRSNSSGGAYLNCTFNLLTGVNTFNGFTEDFKITSMPDGWLRISVGNRSSASAFRVNSFILSPTNVIDNNSPSHVGNGTSGVYIFGAQLEQGSYATSYIKTVGTTQTRSADTANGAGNASTFNSSEGVLMMEIAALDNDGTFRMLSISDGTNNNRVRINFTSTSEQIQARLVVGGVTQADLSQTSANVTSFNKIAISYKENDVKLYINGILIASDTSASVPTIGTFTTLQFDGGGATSPFYGNTKQIQYFDSALTDSELEKITSWTSFTAMANAQSYTII